MVAVTVKHGNIETSCAKAIILGVMGVLLGGGNNNYGDK